MPSEEDGVFAPRNVRLAPDAAAAFAQFAQFSHQGKAELDGREREYWCKGTAHVLRLAGTLAFLDWAWTGGPEPQPSPRNMSRPPSLLWRDYFWPHARAALRQMGLSDKHADARRVLRWIKANGKQRGVARGGPPRGARPAPGCRGDASRDRCAGASRLAQGGDG